MVVAAGWLFTCCGALLAFGLAALFAVVGCAAWWLGRGERGRGRLQGTDRCCAYGGGRNRIKIYSKYELHTRLS